MRRHPIWSQYNEFIKKLIHIFCCSPTINNTDISISAREASPGQTLPLAFKQTSAGTYSPRLPWGGDTPVPDRTVVLGSVSFTPAVLIAAERLGDTQRQRGKRGTTHIREHTCFRCCICLEPLGWGWDIQINGWEWGKWKMKNVLGETLTLSNAGNWRETYRNARGMYKQMNVEKKEKILPGACLITYCIFVVGTKKAAVQTQNCPHNPMLWNWERSQLLIAYHCVVNLSSVLKLQCTWYLLLVCYDLIALSDLSAVWLQHSPVCLGAN